jgi:hypothetical protein
MLPQWDVRTGRGNSLINVLALLTTESRLRDLLHPVNPRLQNSGVVVVVMVMRALFSSFENINLLLQVFQLFVRHGRSLVELV